jgi:hypothetical protein
MKLVSSYPADDLPYRISEQFRTSNNSVICCNINSTSSLRGLMTAVHDEAVIAFHSSKSELADVNVSLLNFLQLINACKAGMPRRLIAGKRPKLMPR